MPRNALISSLSVSSKDLRTRFPGSQLVGRFHGTFLDSDERPTQVLVLDLGALDGVSPKGITRDSLQCVPLIIVGSVSRAFARKVQAAAIDRPNLSVLLPHEDAERTLKAATIHAVRYQVVERMEQHWRGLPKRTRKALRDTLIQSPMETPIRVTDQIAEKACCTRRTFYRQLERIGIRNPKALVHAGRVLRVIPNLYSREPLRAVATRAGYPVYFDFQREVKHLLGAGPQHVRHYVDPGILAHRIATALMSGEKTPPRKRTVVA